jgi:hypothetical protein
MNRVKSKDSKIDLRKDFLGINEDVIPDRKAEEVSEEYTFPAPEVDGNVLGLVYPVSGWMEITSL